MSETLSLKIDIFSHVLPVKYKEALEKAAPNHLQQSMNSGIPTLWDMDHRFELMDKYGLIQVPTLSRPPIEEVISDPQQALDLTKLANDEMAEIVRKYPNRFPAAAAAVALNNIDGTLKEMERAFEDLKLRGAQIYSSVNDKPLDSPEFMPFFELMARYNLPVWIHPTTGITATDHKSENRSKYTTSAIFGWPYETTIAMSRIVFGGILEKWPNLKVITHHCGALIPYFEQRIIGFHDYDEMVMGGKDKVGLSKPPIEYYKMFYADTALYGNAPALTLGHSFFGDDHLLFGTDFPFTGHFGERVTRQAIAAIEEMEISNIQKRKIYEDNARNIIRLPI